MMKSHKINKTLALLFFISAILFLNGCKSKKIIETGTGELTKKSQEQVVTDVLSKEIDYKTISAKGSIEFKMGSKSRKLNTVYKLIKDEVLQASVRIPILGGEAMRITITPDSVIIIDRLNKQYVAERFKDSQLASNFDFNFYNLQSLFTNKIFIPGTKSVEKKNYDKMRIIASKDAYMLQTKDKSDMLYTFAIDASDHLVSTLIYNEKKKVTLQWSYSDFIQDNELIYPTRIEANVDIAKKRFDLGIAYNKLELDQDVSIDNSVSSRYQRVDFTELMGTYIKSK
ncbi:hypothetical protein GGR21_000851 [Dysgonomonas hofstadii]|uniref:DUF4292 domain-containing protein n=1 Tax=Dysgonomonas hofstadii TaxID=637886 RepID=A0A840CN65_9BACT|nr:DUF4292 domain-containing protein [Dysgonomonas hofstadii]MBB4034964.1 hypothetical protein [Dysgonomonas hofstadii]